MSEWEKAKSGTFYMLASDPELVEGLKKSQDLNYRYNQLHPSMLEERQKMIRENFGSIGSNFKIEQPFIADYWERIFVGENFYSNYRFTILAGNIIEIGDNVMFGPECGLYAAGHPFDAEYRATGAEYAWPIKIGNNVWIGGGTKIVGGVSVGDNTVIAAGSVVTKSIPSNVLAGGNPCKVIRQIRPEDDEKYRKGFLGF